MRCVKLDKFVRKNYDNYLRNAVIIAQSNSAFNTKWCYCMTTYVNRLGLWQVIGSDGPKGLKVNTFVRLGDGYLPKKVKKIMPVPKWNYWNPYW